jgi:hypothetical protein
MKKVQISQKALERYQQLYDLEKKFKSQRQALRDQLIEMLRNTACVEKGGLGAELVERSAVSLTRAKVTEALGEDYYLWLREQIEPSQQILLVVGKCKAKKTPKASAKSNAIHKDFALDDCS